MPLEQQPDFLNLRQKNSHARMVNVLGRENPAGRGREVPVTPRKNSTQNFSRNPTIP